MNGPFVDPLEDDLLRAIAADDEVVLGPQLPQHLGCKDVLARL